MGLGSHRLQVSNKDRCERRLLLRAKERPPRVGLASAGPVIHSTGTVKLLGHTACSWLGRTDSFCSLVSTVTKKYLQLLLQRCVLRGTHLTLTPAR